MIILKNVSLAFGTQTVFSQLNNVFQVNDRVGIVGRNGTGKSTLLKVIAGLQKADEGHISIDKKKRLAYLPQEMVVYSSKSVFDEAYGTFEEFINMQKRQSYIEYELAQGSHQAEELLDEYTYILEKLASFDLIAAEKKTHMILSGLGFSQEQLQQPVDTLSVGWKMRLVLAKLLLTEADFYLFDEPTNHLDLTTKEWFFHFLKSTSFGFLLVSHDRYFLERSCTSIFELERGKGTLYNGNFNDYLAQKEQRQLATLAAYNRQQKEIERKQEFIDKFRASASRAKQAQSVVKQLEKMELIEIEPALPNIKLTFPAVEQAGKVVLTVSHIAHSFDNKELFRNVSFEIMRGEKVALIAPNGTGKTTLFNLLVNKYPLQHGEITIGYNVKSAFFEQDQTRALNPNNTIFQEVVEHCSKIADLTIRTFLGSFLFSGDDIHKKTSVLSGGEKNRVAMVKTLLQRANFLILDEPTNHLDLYAKDILLQALQQYDGTILIVSHDHNFIQQLANRILELTPSGIYRYEGTYEAYLEHKKLIQQPTPPITVEPFSQPQKATPPKKNNFEHQKEIQKYERKIAQLEQEQRKLQEAFAHYEYGTPLYQELIKKLDIIQKDLDTIMQAWEALLQELD